MTGTSGESGHVAHLPPRTHVCRPGWEERVSDGSDPSFPAGTVTLHPLDLLPAGTVWECSCGRFYVAVAWKDWERPGTLLGRIDWRPEKRRERRRRLSISGGSR